MASDAKAAVSLAFVIAARVAGAVPLVGRIVVLGMGFALASAALTPGWAADDTGEVPPGVIIEPSPSGPSAASPDMGEDGDDGEDRGGGCPANERPLELLV